MAWIKRAWPAPPPGAIIADSGPTLGRPASSPLTKAIAAQRPFSSLKWLLVLAVLVLSGCNSQPRVTSPEAFELIKQAYTACNTKSAKRLANTKQRFEELKASGTLSEAEQVAFLEILDLAEQGDWERAQDRAFSFADSQVN